jgi:hypothetical protein
MENLSILLPGEWRRTIDSTLVDGPLVALVKYLFSALESLSSDWSIGLWVNKRGFFPLYVEDSVPGSTYSVRCTRCILNLDFISIERPTCPTSKLTTLEFVAMVSILIYIKISKYLRISRMHNSEYFALFMHRTGDSFLWSSFSAHASLEDISTRIEGSTG